MRQLLSRPAALVVCAFALCLASCSSNNKGKIEGKWKNSSPISTLPAGVVTAEFKPDGTFTMSAGPIVLVTAKYKLGIGDYVTLSDVKTDGKTEKPGKVKVVINGDSMKWTEEKGTYEFTRDKGGDAASPAGEKK